MNLINYFAYVDIFSSMIVLIIILALLYKKAYLSLNGKSLMILAILIFCLTFFEGLTYLIDSSINEYYKLTNEVLNFILFLATPLFLGFWVKYTSFLVNKKQATRTHLLLFFTPTFIVLILIIINIFQPFIYIIDEFGVYKRLFGFIYVSGLSYILVFYSITMQVYYLIKKFNFEITILLMSNIVAFFGSFFQLSETSSLSFYPFITIGFVIIYVFFESIEDSMDQLTRMFDRRKIYEIIDSKILSNKPFSLVVLDLDDLKKLNDNFGHHIGDSAIVNFSENLHLKFHKKGILGRIGGDEFVLISDIPEKHIIEKLDEIDSSFYDNSIKYEYKFSYGISHSEDYSNVDIDILLMESDKKMYDMKAVHKNYKRRASDNKNRRNF